jgi:hypothetical protein
MATNLYLFGTIGLKITQLFTKNIFFLKCWVKNAWLMDGISFALLINQEFRPKKKKISLPILEVDKEI